MNHLHQSEAFCFRSYTRAAFPVQTHVHHTFGTPECPLLYKHMFITPLVHQSRHLLYKHTFLTPLVHQSAPSCTNICSSHLWYTEHPLLYKLMSITPLVHQSTPSCTNSCPSHLWYTRAPPPVQTHVPYTFGTPERPLLYKLMSITPLVHQSRLSCTNPMQNPLPRAKLPGIMTKLAEYF